MKKKEDKEKKSIPNNSSRRTKALLWLTGVLSIIGILLYFEQVAVIYVLSTLGLIVLLLLVGFSDLEKVGVEEPETQSEGDTDKNQADSPPKQIPGKTAT